MRDPITKLAVIDGATVGPELCRLFPDLFNSPGRTAALHYIGHIAKKTRFGFTEKGVLLISNTSIILCKEDGTRKRCVPITKISEVLVFTDGYNAYRVPSEYDMVFRLVQSTETDYVINILCVIQAVMHGRRLQIRACVGTYKSFPVVKLDRPANYQPEFLSITMWPNTDAGGAASALDDLLKPPPPPPPLDANAQEVQRTASRDVQAVLAHPLLDPSRAVKPSAALSSQRGDERQGTPEPGPRVGRDQSPSKLPRADDDQRSKLEAIHRDLARQQSEQLESALQLEHAVRAARSPGAGVDSAVGVNSIWAGAGGTGSPLRHPFGLPVGAAATAGSLAAAATAPSDPRVQQLESAVQSMQLQLQEASMRAEQAQIELQRRAVVAAGVSPSRQFGRGARESVDLPAATTTTTGPTSAQERDLATGAFDELEPDEGGHITVGARPVSTHTESPQPARPGTMASVILTPLAASTATPGRAGAKLFEESLKGRSLQERLILRQYQIDLKRQAIAQMFSNPSYKTEDMYQLQEELVQLVHDLESDVVECDKTERSALVDSTDPGLRKKVAQAAAARSDQEGGGAKPSSRTPVVVIEQPTLSIPQGGGARFAPAGLPAEPQPSVGFRATAQQQPAPSADDVHAKLAAYRQRAGHPPAYEERPPVGLPLSSAAPPRQGPVPAPDPAAQAAAYWQWYSTYYYPFAAQQHQQMQAAAAPNTRSSRPTRHADTTDSDYWAAPAAKAGGGVAAQATRRSGSSRGGASPKRDGSPKAVGVPTTAAPWDGAAADRRSRPYRVDDAPRVIGHGSLRTTSPTLRQRSPRARARR